MPLDGAFLFKLKNELDCVIGSHLDKIHQPSKDELVFLLRSKAGTFRLLISAKSASARVHFTESKIENPATPPMFCMLLRKYLSGARLIEIQQEGLERVITFVFSSTNEMGDIIYPRLICELIGSQPNIIFTTQEWVIIDAVKRSDLETASRIIQPGARYVFPASTQKANILTTKTETITSLILSNSQLPLFKAILDNIDGISPLIAREMALRICSNIEKPIYSLTSSEKMNITGTLNLLLSDIKENSYPVILFDKNNVPKEFSFTKIKQYNPNYTETLYPSFSQVLDAFFIKKENAERIRRNSQDIYKIISVLIARTNKKTALRKKDLINCKDREKYRIYGELIKANLYNIKAGSSSVCLQNYYDQNLKDITIPLNPAISPAANADYYFKEYKKSYTAEKKLTLLIEEDQKDLAYYESVLDNLCRAETIADLNEIRDELSEAGIIRTNKRVKKSKPNNTFREFITAQGHRILVGKNNRQNDTLTLSYANKGDIWFHTKNIPGSHTVLIAEKKEFTQSELNFAASISAYYSKAQNSTGVPVDYTYIKYVKKPNGAKPGMVIYTHEKTLFVTPFNPESNF